MIDDLVANIDVLPTMLQIAGAPVPANVQGKSFLPRLKGDTTPHREEMFGELTYHQYYDPRRCMKRGRYKLTANFSGAPEFMDSSQQWRPKTQPVFPPDAAGAKHPAIELYDLATDPHEQKNLADDADHAAVRRPMMARLLAWMQETGDPLLRGPVACPQYHRTMAALAKGEVPDQPPWLDAPAK